MLEHFHMRTNILRMGHQHPSLIALAHRVSASRLQLLSATQRFSGKALRQRLKIRSQHKFLGQRSVQLGAIALSGAYAVRTSAQQKTLADFGHPGRRMTDLLLVLNLAMYGLQWCTGSCILHWGAKVNNKIVAGQLYRLVSCTFLHGNLLHLFTNCQALSSLGPFVENNTGRARFLALYFISGISGSLASFLFCPNASVGASGAIFGLGAATAMIIYRHRDANRRFSETMLKSLGQTLAINIAIGLYASNIDNWGHAGGLVGGAIAAFLLGPRWVKEGNQVYDRPPLPLFAARPK